jgi:Sortase domain
VRRSVAYRRPGLDPAAWTGPLAVLLVLAGLVATGAGLLRVTGALPLAGGSRARSLPAGPFPVLAESRPTGIAIPAIHLRAPVHEVGLADDGSIMAPPLERHDQAGWYDGGPTPGEYGPAIIVGHVDTRTGPSVFHDLARLRAGTKVEVTRRDGRVAVFTVESVERFDKAAVPADRVYGDFSRPALRLITCGGRWLGGSTGYADNVVVFASLTGTRGS